MLLIQARPGKAPLVEVLMIVAVVTTAAGLPIPRFGRASERASSRLKLGLVYEVDTEWAERASFSGTPYSVAVDQSTGHVYVLQRGGHTPVSIVDADSAREISNWTMEPSPSKLLDTPHGLRLHPNGASGDLDAWITDVGNMTGHVLRRFSKDGYLYDIIGFPGKSGSTIRPIEFGNVAEVAFARSNTRPTGAGADGQPDSVVDDGSYRVYIVDGDGGPNNRVQRMYAKEHDFEIEWTKGEMGSQLGQYHIPHDIDSDIHGRLWIADRANARLQIVNASNGEALSQLTCMNLEPYGVRILPQSHEDLLYIAIAAVQNHSVVILEVDQQHSAGVYSVTDNTCRVIQTITFNSTASPHLMDVQRETGTLFVADITSATVHKLVVK